MTVLEFDAVTKVYSVRGAGQIKALDDVSFTLRSGQTIGLVGQSGSGKSTIAKILTQLEIAHERRGPARRRADPPSRKGSARLPPAAAHGLPGSVRVAQPVPLHPVRHPAAAPARQGRARRTSWTTRSADSSSRVRLDADRVIDRRPHELSGGQRQRVAIARALASRPGILVADEPVSMLDVSIRLGVLNLLADLQREEGLGVLYITHDLATARHFSDEILVLNQGRVVERGPADDVILRPQNPYTQELRAASPDPDSFFAHAAGILGGEK